MADESAQLALELTTKLEQFSAGLSLAQQQLVEFGASVTAAMAEMAAGTAAGSADVYAQLANLGAAFRETASAANEATHRMEGGWKEAKEQVSSVYETTKQLLELYGAFKAFEWTKGVVEGGLEAGEMLRNLSIRTSLSVGDLQRLRFAGDSTGVSLEGLATLVGTLDQKLQTLRNAAPGGGGNVAAAFRDLEIDPSKLHSGMDAINALAGAINKFGETPKVLGDLRNALGRSGTEILPLLESFKELSAEAEKAGVVLSDSLVGAAWKGQEALNGLTARFHAVELAIAGAFAPAIKIAATLLGQLLEKVLAMSHDGSLVAWGIQVADIVVDVAKRIVVLTSEIVHFIETLDRLISKAAVFLSLKGIPSSFHEFLLGTPEGTPETNKLMAFSNDPGDKAAAAAAGTGQVDSYTQSILDGLDQLKAQTHKAFSLEELNKEKIGAHHGPQQQKDFESAAQIAAAHKAKEKLLEDAKEEAALEIAESGNTAQAKMFDLQKVEDLAIKLFGVRSKEARAASVAELDAQKEYFDQQQALAEHAVENKRKISDLEFAQQKELITQSLQLGQITKAQELQAQIDLNDKKYQADLNYLEEQRDLAGLTVRQEQQVQEQIDALTAQHLTQRTQLVTQALQNQMQLQQQAAKEFQADLQPVADSLNTMFDNAITGTQSLQQSFSRMIGSMLLDLLKLTIEGTILGGKPGTFTGELFGQGLAGAFLKGGSAFGPATGTTASTTAEEGPLGAAGGWLRGLLGGGAKIPGTGDIAGPPDSAALYQTTAPITVAATSLTTAGTGLTAAATALSAAAASLSAASATSAGAALGDATGAVKDASGSLSDATGALKDTSGALSGGGLGGGFPSGTDIAQEMQIPGSTGLDLNSLNAVPAADAGGGAGFGQIGAGLSLLTNAANGAAGGKSPSGISGAFGGAMSGAELGSMFGPWGALIGGIGGGIAGLFGFEEGGISNTTQLAMLHPKEMVLPKHLSEGMQSLIASGGAGGGRGGEGGDTHLHAHMNINTIDSNSFKSTLAGHKDVILDMLSTAVRNSDRRIGGKR